MEQGEEKPATHTDTEDSTLASLPLLTIGWREIITLPAWGVDHLTAKSDTGALGSAIDVKNLKELPGDRVRFDVVLDRLDRSKTKTIVAPISGRTRVRSSNGKVMERYKVKTRLRIGDHEKTVEFSLVNRRSMLCRVLLGRRAMEGDFLVDSSRKYLFGTIKHVRARLQEQQEKPRPAPKSNKATRQRKAKENAMGLRRRKR